MAIGSGVLLPGVAENPTFPILSALAYTTGLGYRPTCDYYCVQILASPPYVDVIAPIFRPILRPADTSASRQTRVVKYGHAVRNDVIMTACRPETAAMLDKRPLTSAISDG